MYLLINRTHHVNKHEQVNDMSDCDVSDCDVTDACNKLLWETALRAAGDEAFSSSGQSLDNHECFRLPRVAGGIYAIQ